jgi:anthranilate/para-aminobenzoate synthase component II
MAMMPVIDDYGSLTHNLVQRIEELGHRGIPVARNDKVTLADVRDVLLPNLISGEIRGKEAERLVVEPTT